MTGRTLKPRVVQSAPSPILPLFFVAVMLVMAAMPWYLRYHALFKIAAYQTNYVLLIVPLVLVMVLSLMSSVPEWASPNPPMYGRSRNWNSGHFSGEHHHGDGAGIGLFILLVLLLILVPWR